MIPLGLTAAELDAFHRQLATHHTATVGVGVLTLEGEPVSSLSTRVIDGQVNVNADAEVTRSGTLTLLDPTRSLHFDSGSPDDGAFYFDRMLRVTYSVLVPEINRRITTPVLTGPVVKYDRSGDEISVEVQGKELLALAPTWRPLTLKKGMRKTEAIRTILAERAGETRLAIPSHRSRFTQALSMTRMTKPWPYARGLADGLNRQLYYDGAGTARARQYPMSPLFTFTADRPGATITKPVDATQSIDKVKNTVWVRGGVRQDDVDSLVGWVAYADENHPLSPSRLGRNGSPRFLVEEIEDPLIGTVAEARELAERVLHDRLLDVSQYKFDCLPIPHLDPMDLIRVETNDLAANHRLRQWSFPLTVGGEMSVGYMHRVSTSRKQIRR